MRTPLILFLLAEPALAQTDEWSTPPPQPVQTQPSPAATTPPAQPAPTPSSKPSPAQTPAQGDTPTVPEPQGAAQPPAPSPRAVPPATESTKPLEPATPSSAARARAEERLKSATGEDEKLPIVSKEERYEAGTEPHSPATREFQWKDPNNARVSLGQVGVGTAYLPSARLGRKHLVRVGFVGEYLSLRDFPVRNAQNIRSAIAFSASYQPFDWGEVFLAYSAAANTNNRTSPNLIQALGDLTLGVKASRQWAKGFWAGGDLRLLTFSGVGNQSIDRFAVGVRPLLIATYDVRSALPSVPVMLAMNLGFTLDSTGGLVKNQKLNASEEFALGINRYHRFNFGMAVEAPLPWVTPFIEYKLGAPLGVANGQLIGPDGLVFSVSAAMPQDLGLGLKVTAVKDLTILTGFNIGLTRSVGLGVAATAPWNFYLGSSFAIDPFQRGETKYVDTLRERKVDQKVPEAPKTARVAGTVVDAATNKPIEGVIISVEGALPTASDASGKFSTLELTPPKAKLTASRDGYVPLEQEAALVAGKAATVDLALMPDAKLAALSLSATANKKPVAASIELRGSKSSGEPTLQTVGLDAKASEPTKVEVAAGVYSVVVNAPGYLSQTRDIQVPVGGAMSLTFELVPTPKKVLVVFKGDRIEILQQVHFATGKAQILADSFNLLQQVVDVVIKNNVKRVRIEGHTDSRGSKAGNQTLSENRARAVLDFLVAQGIDAARLESVGHGDTKPVAPNLTARGRELNRRVEFIVLEK